MKNKSSNNSGTIGKAVSIAIFIMAGSNILSRLLGFVRLKVLASLAGTNAIVDAYSFSFLLPDLINHLLAGSALSITFIPIFQKLIIDKGEDDAWRFFSNLMTIGTSAFSILTVLSMIFTRQALFFAGKNINNPDNIKQFILTVKLTRIILPAQLFFFWGALLNGVQYSKKHFILPALTPLLYNLGIISGGLFLFPYIGIEGFSWGVLTGAFIGNVVVQIPGALRVGMRYKFFIKFKDPNLIKWIIITAPLVLGLGMTFSNEFLFRFFGSISPDGAGSLASLDYSYKIMMMIVGIFGQSFAVGIYPFISQLAAENKLSEMNMFINNILTKIAALIIPISGLMLVLAENVIVVLLQGGNFNVESTTKTSQAFIYYLPGTFFTAGVLVINRIYYSVKNTITPLLINSVSVLLCVPIYYYLGNKVGIEGIALSSSILVSISFFSLLFIWNIFFKKNCFTIFLRKFILIIFVSIIGILLCYFIKSFIYEYIPEISSMIIKHLVICIVSGVPSLLFIGFISELSGIQNYREMISNLIKHLIKR